MKDALSKVDGNKARAAILLGCSRETLYKWCSQYGLDKYAGICRYTPVGTDKRERQGTQPAKADRTHVSGVNSGASGSASLRLVAQTVVSDLPVPATVKVPDSIWERMKIEAIRRKCSVSSLAEQAFRIFLEAEQPQPKARKKGGGD